TLWFENIFPIKISPYDPRYFLFRKYADDAAKKANLRLIPTKFEHPFIYVGAEPAWKEGGMFVHFQYEGEPEDVLKKVRENIEGQALRSWTNFKIIKAHLVEGKPFVDDMISRIPSRILKVDFDGPDVPLETLYQEFRVYGRIADITLPPPGSKDLPRSALIEFVHVRSATSARNCLYGKRVEGTKLTIGYQKQPAKWPVWQWMTSHPRIMIPIVLALLAGVTYIIFDPIRVFFISSKLRGRLNLENYTNGAEKLWSWTKSSVLGTLGRKDAEKDGRLGTASTDGWSERQAEEERLARQLTDNPDTLTLVSGPRGSGKNAIVKKALHDRKYKIVINCEDLVGQDDHIIMKRLAQQIAFYPQFNFLVQMSGMADTLIAATTGAKAGLSTTVDGQIRKMLDCLSITLNRVNMEQKRARDKLLAQMKSKQLAEEKAAKKALGDGESVERIEGEERKVDAEGQRRVQEEDGGEVEYPIIVIEGFLSREGGKGAWVYQVLTDWAAVCAEYHLAHVIFISENPSASKMLSKAMSNRLLELYSLSDATPEAAMAFVRRRMGSVGDQEEDLEKVVEAIGGRLTDLELMIQKMRAGLSCNGWYFLNCGKLMI
ncbi:mitochondrial escape protein 2, partial [Rhizophlyctis rosea]